MYIENHTLHVDAATYPLPHLAAPSKVHVWRVPVEYRADGIFFSVQAVGQPMEAPACAGSDAVYLGQLDLDPHPDAVLADRKAAKKRQIEAERDAESVQDVEALARKWQADKRSQELLASALAIANAGGPLPAVWRDADNNDMPINDVSQLLAIAGAIAAQTQAAYAKSWARKAAVDAATTEGEVDAA
jgi:hypothetical protein